MLAKKGQHQAAKTVAKTVAMSRKQKNNFYNMTAQLKGISMQLSAMGTSNAVMDALKGSTAVMNKANEQLNIQDISSMIKQFQKESMKAEMNQDMVADAMDMGDVNEEADDVYGQILGEIGLNMQDG